MNRDSINAKVFGKGEVGAVEEKEKSFSRKGSFPLPRLSSGGEAAQKEFVPAGSSHQQDKIINKNE